MALSNLYGWKNNMEAPTACGSACGSGDRPEAKATACGSACGSGDKLEGKATACGSACGSGDK